MLDIYSITISFIFSFYILFFYFVRNKSSYRNASMFWIRLVVFFPQYVFNAFLFREQSYSTLIFLNRPKNQKRNEKRRKNLLNALTLTVINLCGSNALVLFRFVSLGVLRSENKNKRSSIRNAFVDSWFCTSFIFGGTKKQKTENSFYDERKKQCFLLSVRGPWKFRIAFRKLRLGKNKRKRIEADASVERCEWSIMYFRWTWKIEKKT